MNWPWTKREACPTQEAEDAATHAKRALLDAQNFDRRVDRVADELSKTRERNHFAAAVAKAIRGV